MVNTLPELTPGPPVRTQRAQRYTVSPILYRKPQFNGVKFGVETTGGLYFDPFVREYLVLGVVNFSLLQSKKECPLTFQTSSMITENFVNDTPPVYVTKRNTS